MADPLLFPEVNQILALLQSDGEQDMVILAIPSHEEGGKKLENQEWWAAAAMDLVSKLYRGGTAFTAHSGIYRDDDGKVYKDKPIIIESFAAKTAIEDPERLNRLVEFSKRMGRECKQKSVMLVFGLVMFYIEDFTPARA